MRKLLIILIFPVTLIAQKNYKELLGQYMQAQMNIKGFSGAVLVVQHDRVLLEKGYGLADREWNVQNNLDTKFRIGSITKQFTAACILQLVENGKLNLEDRLSRFIPGYPKGDSVTVQMLLNHTSGIPNYTAQQDFGDYSRLSWSQDSMIRYFEKRPFEFSPGAKFSYSNSNFFLLGQILETLSGQSYEVYLRQHILDKIGMSNTGLDKLDSILPSRARGYIKNKDRLANAPYISMEWQFSAGVLYSTVGDLYKWDRALYGTTILSEASKKKMFTPGKGNYGYGIQIDSLENHFRIWHNGGIPGFLSNFSRFVDDDLCIIVLSNNQSNVDFISIGLADILFNVPVELPYMHKEVKIDPSLLDRYVGKYTAFLTLVVIKKDGKLYRHRDGTPDIELKPESATKFFYADDSDRQLEFELNQSGQVVKTWFFNNGQKGEMKRIE